VPIKVSLTKVGGEAASPEEGRENNKLIDHQKKGTLPSTTKAILFQHGKGGKRSHTGR